MEFSYKALQNDKIVTGVIEADNEEAALSILRGNKLTILGINAKTKPISSSFSSLFGKVKFTDIVDFTRQLSIMLTSGLTLIDSLDILKRQSENPALLRLIQQIDTDVKAGLNLSDALAKHKQLFSNLYISLVKAGEASGKLDEILKKLSENLERQRLFKSKIKGAMMYPIIVIVAMLGVMFVMISFVIPKLLAVYKDFNIELPAPTLILIALSDFFSAYWTVVVGVAVGVIIAISRAIKSRKGKRMFDQFTLRLPIMSRVIKIAALVDTTRTLSILISAGVSILEALDIITETTGNIVYQEAFVSIKHAVERGEGLGNALEATHIFPPILVQMTTVGESTGHLDETLGHLANYFESESEIAIKALTTLIEPAILVVLGVTVGFVVIAVITPIFSLSSAF